MICINDITLTWASGPDFYQFWCLFLAWEIRRGGLELKTGHRSLRMRSISRFYGLVLLPTRAQWILLVLLKAVCC